MLLYLITSQVQAVILGEKTGTMLGNQAKL